MKKILCALVLTCSVLQADNFYGGLIGGVNWAENRGDSYKSGYMVGGDFGFRWCDGFRTEIEYIYRSNSNQETEFCLHKNRSEIDAGMFNVLFDFPDYCYWSVTPFIGLGVGVAWDKRHLDCNDLCSTHKHRFPTFAWQYIAGITYPFFDRLDLNLQYRFFRTNERQTNNHGLSLGLNCNF